MRKAFILIITIAGLILTSCGEQDTEIGVYEVSTTETTVEASTHSVDDDVPATAYTIVETAEGMQRIFPPGTLNIEHFLEDLDYMMYVLENNFALLDVAYWAWGMDARVLAAQAREDVLAAYAEDRLCEDMYLAILWKNFFPMFNTGHFAIFSPLVYHNMLTNPYGGYRSPGVVLNNQLLETPLALRFYESRVQDRLQNRDYFNVVLSELRYETEGVYNRFWGDFSDDRRGLWQPPENNVTTEIIEEGKIAYIAVNSFMLDRATWSANQRQIFDFYGEIRDFEHLIIDLRGNSGGNVDYFINFFMRPNLENMVTVNSFHFFMDGPYIRRLGEYIFAPTISNGHLVIPSDYRPVSEILEAHDLPELNALDFNRLHYGVASGTGRIQPNRNHFDFEVAFPGKIWLLTDQRMGSAAQLAAWISMESGFATHVGETTGGNFGGLRTLALLPNTGIAIYFDVFYITDERGRPLEAGTIPHYFNLPGMDALETVLALIEER